MIGNILERILHIRIFRLLDDKLYLKLMYLIKEKKRLHLSNPKTFNEKLQWLKLYDRKPEYTTMVDKYAVKEYIADKIGNEYIIPTLGVWDKFDDINFEELPNQFVLKCTHDSGSVVICKDKKSFDFVLAKKKLDKCIKRNYYYGGREWPYKNVTPRIIAEKFFEDSEGLKDYKLMCFNGCHKCTFTCTERFTVTGLKVTFFDKDWNKMPFQRHYPSSDKKIVKPRNYTKMVELAEKLSQEIPFLRVDFYEIGEQIYFGELTFYPGNGFEEFTPEKWDEILGSWIQLPEKKGNV